MNKTASVLLGMSVCLACGLTAGALASNSARASELQDAAVAVKRAPTADELLLRQKTDIAALAASKEAPDKYLLALMYHTGRGAVKDDELAAKYLQEVAGQLPAAANALGSLYAFGQGVPKDLTKASEYYKQAAEGGNAQAQNNLGYLCFTGQGVEKSYEKAAELFEQAAKQGLADAQSNLGWMYQHGYGVKKDYKKAAHLYELAAAQGLAAGRYNLGYLYEYGLGVPLDLSKSSKLMEVASAQKAKGKDLRCAWGDSDLSFTSRKPKAAKGTETEVAKPKQGFLSRLSL